MSKMNWPTHQVRRGGEPLGLLALARTQCFGSLEAIGSYMRKKMVNHSRVEPLICGECVGVGEDVVPEPTRDEQHRARLELAVHPRKTRMRDWADV